jgi:acyl-CoA reductase-like NAD-dependent aldehyde dehydrogenase
MAQTTHAEWQEKAQAARFRTQAFIDGRYVDAQSGATFDNVNPANGKVFAKVAATDAADVDLAVKAARRAFDAGKWSRAAPAERKRVLLSSPS